MPESAAAWFDRVTGEIESQGHREVAWQSWPTWPFEPTQLTPRVLAPLGSEPTRAGAGGQDCHQCRKAEDPSYIFWRDDLFMLGVPFGATALPFTCFLMPRRHVDLADLSDDESARSGQLLTLIERAACQVLDIPRIQVARWGDGSEHLHWWLMARPTGAEQLRGTFLALWDDVLPARDPGDLRADLDVVAERLVELAGGEQR